MAATKELGPGGREIWRSKGGKLQQWSPAPGVLCCEFNGDMPEDLAPPYLAFLQQLATQSPQVIVFDDTEGLVNYETGFRTRCTQAHKQLGDRIEALHILARSKIVTLGIQVTSLILKNLIAHDSRETFNAALAKAVAERTRAH